MAEKQELTLDDEPNLTPDPSTLPVAFDVDALEELRLKVGMWSGRNFGHTLPEHNPRTYAMLRNVAGMVEELGEVLEATGMEDALDAVADLCIFSLDYLWNASIVVPSVLPRHVETGCVVPLAKHLSLFSTMTICIGRIGHFTLKRSQQIRSQETELDSVRPWIRLLWVSCARYVKWWYSADLSQLVKDTAEKVLQRDWLAHPNTAHLHNNK